MVTRWFQEFSTETSNFCHVYSPKNKIFGVSVMHIALLGLFSLTAVTTVMCHFVTDRSSTSKISPEFTASRTIR
jgi:hypothetical protein